MVTPGMILDKEIQVFIDRLKLFTDSAGGRIGGFGLFKQKQIWFLLNGYIIGWNWANYVK